MKKKGTTALLALLFGVFGLHRFYLGQRLKAFLHLGLFLVTLMATIGEGVPFIIAAAIIGFIDAVLFFVMPKEEFDEKHNSKYLDAQPRRARRQFSERSATDFTRRRRSRVQVDQMDTFKESGMRKYDDYQIEAAIVDFRKSLNSNFKDSTVHFLIACCYSINEEVEKSLFHLDKAVDFGFIDFEKIHSVEALAFLRTDERFEAFVKNSYQIPRYLSNDVDEKLDVLPDEKANDLLDQIAALGELYEKGVLTPEEFQKQKDKIISS